MMQLGVERSRSDEATPVDSPERDHVHADSQPGERPPSAGERPPKPKNTPNATDKASLEWLFGFDLMAGRFWPFVVCMMTVGVWLHIKADVDGYNMWKKCLKAHENQCFDSSYDLLSYCFFDDDAGSDGIWRSVRFFSGSLWVLLGAVQLGSWMKAQHDPDFLNIHRILGQVFFLNAVLLVAGPFGFDGPSFRDWVLSAPPMAADAARWLMGPIWYLVAFLSAVVVIMAFLIICVVAPYLAWSERGRSYAYSVWLMYKHGTTYFGASLLMSPLEFFDTAAMYALFRVADDIVDTLEPDILAREKQFDLFVADFYKSWESGKGDFNIHPCLPAIVETSVRRKYGKQLFIDFFRSMRMDLRQPNICWEWEDTHWYMRGSAAVIGDFMLPVLMPDPPSGSSIAEFEDVEARRAKALPYAQDLGNAFQLTNMIRDIHEDLGLNRLYMPAQVLYKYNVIEYLLAQGGVDYARSSLATTLLKFDRSDGRVALKATTPCTPGTLSSCWSAPSTPGPTSGDGCSSSPSVVRPKIFSKDFSPTDPEKRFINFLEAAFAHADECYVQADIGIEMLPENVKHLIRFAMVAYHTIQDEIRKKDYNIFSQRVRVSKWKKFSIASKVIPIKQLFRLFFMDLCFAQLFSVAPLVTLALGVGIYGELILPTVLQGATVTYAGYHCIWTLPAVYICLSVGLGGRILEPRRSTSDKGNYSKFFNPLRFLGFDTGNPFQEDVGGVVSEPTLKENNDLERAKCPFSEVRGGKGVVVARHRYKRWMEESNSAVANVPIVSGIWSGLTRWLLREDEPTKDENGRLYRTHYDPDWYRNMFLRWTLILMVVAFTWATPWDNFLVYCGAWGYDDGSTAAPSRVLAVIGWVPIEEYSFFLIQTFLVCLAWYIQFGKMDNLQLPPNYNLKSGAFCGNSVKESIDKHASKLAKQRRLGTFILAGAFLVGLKMVLDGLIFDPVERANGLYMGLILIWCTPILGLIWSCGAGGLLANNRGLLNIVLPCWIFLSLSDCWAIRQGCWNIESKYILPAVYQPFGIDNLPIEECTFFLVTTLMCAFGLHAGMCICTIYKIRKEDNWADLMSTSKTSCAKLDKNRLESFEEAVKIAYHWDGAATTTFTRKSS